MKNSSRQKQDFNVFCLSNFSLNRNTQLFKVLHHFSFQSFATIDGLYQTTYEEELEINDFPQSCRWKVTSREAIGNITDYSEADIQIRGVYYPPGKEPGEGEERKLFLLITGQTELSVQKARVVLSSFQIQSKVQLGYLECFYNLVRDSNGQI